MAVDPAAFVKWRYQQVLFSQPPWQSYRLFSSAADPCLLLTVLATDPPILQGLLLFLSLPLFLFASLLRSFLTTCSRQQQKPARMESGVGCWWEHGNQPPPHHPPSSKFRVTLKHTHSHSIATTQPSVNGSVRAYAAHFQTRKSVWKSNKYSYHSKS